jgi:hypothetical protein
VKIDKHTVHKGQHWPDPTKVGRSLGLVAHGQQKTGEAREAAALVDSGGRRRLGVRGTGRGALGGDG